MEQLEQSGVYLILNTLNSLIYIGSAVNIKKRWKEHRVALQKGTHVNRHLQRAFSRYGESVFEILLLERTVPQKDILITREQHYLDWLTPFGSNGYNICRKAGSVLGVKHPPEYREQIRQRMIGNIPWNKGKKRPPFSAEWKKKIGDAQRGERNGFYGKTHSEEARRKSSEMMKVLMADPTKNYFYGKSLTGAQNGMYGKTHTSEARERIGAPHRGKKLSKSHREALGRAASINSARAIEQLSLEGQLIARHRTMLDAASIISTSASYLCTLLRRPPRPRTITLRGFQWRYAE